MTVDQIELVANLDYGDEVLTTLRALAVSEFVAGRQPWAMSTIVHRTRADALLLPPGTVPDRAASVHGSEVRLGHGDGWTMLSDRGKNGSASLTVTAGSEESGRAVIEAALEDAFEPPLPEIEEEAVATVGFWLCGPRGPHRYERRIATRPWAEIRRNYSEPVGVLLDRLMGLAPETASGRIALLHGPPGTGKTTALRALALAWGKWCQVDYVLDPERMLADAAYLMTVALGDGDSDFLPRHHEVRPWRLLVLEDCDELIRLDAKRRAGQSLARLLNLTDGILGQGLELLVAITTNEPLARLHPAITRPGRCIAQIEVTRLSNAEARTWLGWRPSDLGPEGATLAELYAHLGELTVVGPAEPDEPSTGNYL